MKLLDLSAWPLWIAVALMAIAAVINARNLRVPNKLSIPALAAGWVAAILVSSDLGIPSQGGGFFSSLVAALIGFALLLPFYLTGWLGAGCIKMHTAFGAWIGCALPPSSAAMLMALCTLLGGGLSIFGYAVKKQSLSYQETPDMRGRLFPAQVTLSLGAIAGIVVTYLLA